MALFCLATSLQNLRERLGNIVIGVNSKNEFNVPSGKKIKVNTYDGINLGIIYSVLLYQNHFQYNY